jgi:hypothetical protein
MVFGVCEDEQGVDGRMISFASVTDVQQQGPEECT